MNRNRVEWENIGLLGLNVLMYATVRTCVYLCMYRQCYYIVCCYFAIYPSLRPQKLLKPNCRVVTSYHHNTTVEINFVKAAVIVAVVNALGVIVGPVQVQTNGKHLLIYFWFQKYHFLIMKKGDWIWTSCGISAKVGLHLFHTPTLPFSNTI